MNFSIPAMVIFLDYAFKRTKNLKSMFDGLSVKITEDNQFAIKRQKSDLSPEEQKEDVYNIPTETRCSISCAYVVTTNEYDIPLIISLAPGIQFPIIIIFHH